MVETEENMMENEEEMEQEPGMKRITNFLELRQIANYGLRNSEITRNS
jgi:hypothetical protein